MNLLRVATLGAATALLVPAAAHAATLETDAPCYLEGQGVGVRGTGWGPGTAWSVRADQIFAQGVADPTGTWTDLTQVKAPIVPEITTAPTTVTLTGQQDGTDVASTTFQVVNFLVDPKGRATGKPTQKTTFAFSGFVPGQAIYVHVKKKGSSKVYTNKVGTAATPCGTLSKRLKRLPAVPAKKIKFGNYTLAFDSRKKYAKPNGQFNQFTLGITIYKKFV